MYLVYLPDVGRSSKPLIQKHVGRRPARLPNDQEEDQSRNPRRRRAYNGIAGTEDLEVGDDRRVSQRPVELAALVPRFDEVLGVVGVPAEVRQVFTRRSHAVEDLREDGDASRRYQGHELLHRLFGIRRDDRGDILIIALREGHDRIDVVLCPETRPLIRVVAVAGLIRGLCAAALRI